MVILKVIVEGDRGEGARENRGWEGYGRREKKGREAGEKFKKARFRYLLLLIIQSKKRTQQILYSRKVKNENSYSENSITSGEIGNLFKSLT